MTLSDIIVTSSLPRASSVGDKRPGRYQCLYWWQNRVISWSVWRRCKCEVVCHLCPYVLNNIISIVMNCQVSHQFKSHHIYLDLVVSNLVFTELLLAKNKKQTENPKQNKNTKKQKSTQPCKGTVLSYFLGRLLRHLCLNSCRFILKQKLEQWIFVKFVHLSQWDFWQPRSSLEQIISILVLIILRWCNSTSLICAMNSAELCTGHRVQEAFLQPNQRKY